jgi:hypothetical protein
VGEPRFPHTPFLYLGGRVRNLIYNFFLSFVLFKMINVLHVYGIVTNLSNIHCHKEIYDSAQISKYLEDTGVEGYKLTKYVRQLIPYDYPENFIVKIMSSSASEIDIFIGFVIDKIYTWKYYNTGMPPYPEPCGFYNLNPCDAHEYGKKLDEVLKVMMNTNFGIPRKSNIMIDFINPEQDFRNLDNYI